MAQVVPSSSKLRAACGKWKCRIVAVLSVAAWAAFILLQGSLLPSHAPYGGFSVSSRLLAFRRCRDHPGPRFSSDLVLDGNDLACVPGSNPVLSVSAGNSHLHANISWHPVHHDNQVSMGKLSTFFHTAGNGLTPTPLLSLAIHSKLSDAKHVIDIAKQWQGPLTWVVLSDDSRWSELRLNRAIDHMSSAGVKVDVHFVAVGWDALPAAYPSMFMHEVAQSLSRTPYILVLPSLSRPGGNAAEFSAALEARLAGSLRQQTQQRTFALRHVLSPSHTREQQADLAEESCSGHAVHPGSLPLVTHRSAPMPGAASGTLKWRNQWAQQLLRETDGLSVLDGLTVHSAPGLQLVDELVWGASLAPSSPPCLKIEGLSPPLPRLSLGSPVPGISAQGILPARKASKEEHRIRLAIGHGVTLVTMTKGRAQLVKRMVAQYCNLPDVLAVLVISNDVNLPAIDPSLFSECPPWIPITSIVATQNKWKNRFDPDLLLQGVQTAGMLLMDDDMLFAADAVRDAVWSHLNAPRRHLGFIARAGVQGAWSQGWEYLHGNVHSQAGAFNFVLVGASIFHADYAVRYAEGFSDIWEYVDRVFQCDDIGFAFVVARESQRASIWLNAPYRRISPDSSGQFTKAGAMTTRAKCLEAMHVMMPRSAPSLFTNPTTLVSGRGHYKRPEL